MEGEADEKDQMVIRTAKGDKRCDVGRAMEKRRIKKGRPSGAYE